MQLIFPKHHLSSFWKMKIIRGKWKEENYVFCEGTSDPESMWTLAGEAAVLVNAKCLNTESDKDVVKMFWEVTQYLITINWYSGYLEFHVFKFIFMCLAGMQASRQAKKEVCMWLNGKY